nr:winged helix DNA-binding protein [Sphingobium amiense]
MDPIVSSPIASPDARLGLLVIGDWIDIDDVTLVAEAAGLRLLGVTDLDHASARLDEQTRCDTLLLFCPAAGPTLERLLVQAETQAIQTGMAVILVAGWETMDLAYACLRSPYTQLLCDPDQTELAAALVASAERRPHAGLVHDINGESARLQQLSDEVGRLARTIDALTQRPRSATPSFDLGPRISDRPSDYIGMPLAMTGPDLSRPAKAAGTDTDRPVTAAQVRDMLRARRLRADFLPGDLFADPAWDMLLDLLAAHLDQDRVSVSSLCIAAAVPPTTALRHIRTLTDRGLVERLADPHDGRRVFISLTQETADALTRWFGASRRLLCG